MSFTSSTFLLVILCVTGCSSSAAPNTVLVFKDVAYGPHSLQKIDIYLPDGNCNKFVFFVHGGSWQRGDKSKFDKLANYFKSKGIGYINVNYRLSPEVAHPTHVEDIATAFNYSLRFLQAKGYTPKFTVVGHSAGGHLVSLLATNEKYSKLIDQSKIASIVSVSGVYEINFAIRVYGVDHIFTSRESYVDASPISFARKGLPFFHIFYAQHEYLTLPDQAIRFYKLLTAQGNNCTLERMADTNHDNIIWQVMNEKSALGKLILNKD